MSIISDMTAIANYAGRIALLVLAITQSSVLAASTCDPPTGWLLHRFDKVLIKVFVRNDKFVVLDNTAVFLDSIDGLDWQVSETKWQTRPVRSRGEIQDIQEFARVRLTG